MQNLVKTLKCKAISFFKSKNLHLFHHESKTTETPINHTQSLIEVMKMMSVPEAHHSLLCFQLTGKSRKCGPMI
ncbi:hypothetical protein C5167_028371 [Papaver somniferum]|nr:hypothetical protein C5167_028371 [Papaver somniferum]